jgi:hypothetical protein
MVVPTCEERTTSRESVREIFGRKHVHVLVYHVTDGAEAQEPSFWAKGWRSTRAPR